MVNDYQYQHFGTIIVNIIYPVIVMSDTPDLQGQQNVLTDRILGLQHSNLQ